MGEVSAHLPWEATFELQTRTCEKLRCWKKELGKWTLCRSFARRWKETLDNNMIYYWLPCSHDFWYFCMATQTTPIFLLALAASFCDSGWVNIFINDMVGSQLKHGVVEGDEPTSLRWKWELILDCLVFREFKGSKVWEDQTYQALLDTFSRFLAPTCGCTF